MERISPVLSKQEYFWSKLPEFEGLINYIVLKFAHNSQQFEELKSEAIRMYGEIAEYWNPREESSLKSFIGKSIYQNLQVNKLVKKDRHLFLDDETMEAFPSEENPERRSIFEDVIEELGEDAQEIVKIILNTPSEWKEIWKADTCTRRRATLTKILRGYGWGINRIQAVYSEIKTALFSND